MSTPEPSDRLSGEASEVDGTAAQFIRALARADEPAPELAPGTAVGDHFTIVRSLGAGGMGRVYLAFDEHLDRAVAIKVHRSRSDPRGVERMQREARAIARLRHPNVVNVFEVGELGDQLFIAMEHIDGERLDHWQAERPWSEVLAAYQQAGEGLVAAHRAGLVHRDFKPQNAMVETDESGLIRVRVLDFGLARELTDTTDGDERAARATGTATDARAGTPGYVAPEQRTAGEVSEAADQYSFSVALWEGLCGERPGPTPQTRSRRVPTWLLDVVARGLRPDPDDRWPSMRTMLDALGRDPVAARRRRLSFVLSGAALVVIGAAVHAWSGTQDDRCPARDGLLAGVWDEDRRAAVRRALLSSTSAYAEETFERVVLRLDTYADQWRDLADAACRDPSALPPGLAGPQARCLQRRRQALAGITQVLAEASAQTLERAVAAADALPAIEPCGDPEILAAALPPPDNDDVAARVDALRGELGRIEALIQTGRPTAADEAARVAQGSAETIAYPPVHAETLHVAGRARHEAGNPAEAETLLRRAYRLAIRHDHHQIAAVSAQTLIDVVGHALARPADGHEWAFHTETLQAHAAVGPIAATTLHFRGLLYQDEGKYDQSARVLTEALDAERRRLGEGHLALAEILSTLGSTQLDAGNHDRAQASYERALVIREAALPREHPDVAQSLAHLAWVRFTSSDLVGAVDYYERALAIRERAYPGDHYVIAETLHGLGTVYCRLGRFDEAVAALERSLEIQTAVFGELHPRSASTLETLASAFADQGLHTEALSRQRRVVEIFEATSGPDHDDVARALVNLSTTYIQLGRFEESRPGLERALRIQQATLAPDHPSLAHTLSTLGVMHYSLDEFDQALEQQQRALAIRIAAFGEAHLTVADTLQNLSNIDYAIDDADSAAARLRRAIEVTEQAAGAEHPSLITLLFNLGTIVDSLGRHEQAARAFERSLALAEAKLGPDNPMLAFPLTGLGRLDLDHDRPKLAIARLERALTLRQEHATAPFLVPETRFELARARWADGERERAVEAATLARDEYAKIADRGQDVDRVQRWLDEPRRRRWAKTAG
ncbi:MAG: tetratricopeptide repeat-containing serine/threonine-protein kinase [Myxococcota bacterium]